jgi:hypothetical protein
MAADRAATAKAGHGHHHPAVGLANAPVPRPARSSPLAQGLAFRLCWAGALAGLLWLGVVWALQ